jgi:hypothetical protein
MRTFFSVGHLFVFFFVIHSLQAQTFIKYEGQKINEFKKSLKVGVWKLQNPAGTIRVEGTIVDNMSMKDMVYTENGKIFAKQPNDSILMLSMDGEMKSFQIKRLKRNDKKFTYKKGEKMEAPFPYIVELVDEQGQSMDRALMDSLLEKLHIHPFHYNYLKEYSSNFKMPIMQENLGRTMQDELVLLVHLDVNGKAKQVKRSTGFDDPISSAYIGMVRSFPRWQPQFFLGRFEATEFPFPLVYKFKQG